MHSRPSVLAAIALRLLLAAFTAATVVAIALFGMFVGMAPRLISEIVEPLSLLLLPGLIFAIAAVGPHDFSPGTVIEISFLFWFLISFLLLTARTRTSRP